MILITGGLGFVGAHTARAFLDLGESCAAPIELPAGRDPHGPGRDTCLDIARIREDAGYEPAYGIERGMADYVAWLEAGHER